MVSQQELLNATSRKEHISRGHTLSNANPITFVEHNESKLIGRGRSAQVFGVDENTVLKVINSGIPESEVENEVNINLILQQNGVPIPKLYGRLKAGEQDIIAFERLHGRSIYQILLRSPWLLAEYAKVFAKAHAEVTSYRPKGLPSQRKNLIEKLNTSVLTEDRRDKVLRLFRKLKDGEVLCHGDFHIGNVLITNQGPKVIDWGGATVGNPIGDVARTVVSLKYCKIRKDIPEIAKLAVKIIEIYFADRYVQQYRIDTGEPILNEELEMWELVQASVGIQPSVPDAERQSLLRVVDRLLHRYAPVIEYEY